MIIVTGGAGFIGSNLVHGLNRAGIDDILVVDSLSRPHKHLNLGGARFSDYLDKDELFAILPSLGPVEAIFHQGACSDTTEQDGRYMMLNNFSYSKKLLHHCLSAGVPLIYASSAAVYGHGQAPFSENGDTETPLNVYGFSKLVFDSYVRRLLPQARSQVLGLRYFNVYGPREAHKGHMASLVCKMFLRHREGKPLQVFEGSGEFRRDFIHVDDVVSVNLHFLNTGESGILNCGSGQSRSFQDLADLVASQLDGAPIEVVEMPKNLRNQYQKFTCSDNEHLRRSGYSGSFVDLETGVQQYLNDLKRDSSLSYLVSK